MKTHQYWQYDCNVSITNFSLQRGYFLKKKGCESNEKHLLTNCCGDVAMTTIGGHPFTKLFPSDDALRFMMVSLSITCKLSMNVRSH